MLKSRIVIPFYTCLVVMLFVSCKGASGDPVFVVEPSRALIDEPVKIVLSNLSPGETITIHARMRYTSEAVWESWAMFDVDANGQVDVNLQNPLSGTYSGIDGMGLFWSMEEREDVSTSFSRDFLDSVYIELVAENEGNIMATVQIERMLVASNVIRQPVREDGVQGTLFLPVEDDKKYPVVIVLSEEVDSIAENKAALLASHGYATLALYYFRGEPNPGDLIDVPLEYFRNAITWLKTQDKIDGSQIGIVGSSRGGELALLLGATYTDIKAVVAYVPSGVVFQGIDSMSWEPRPAWVHDGMPVPFIPFDYDAFQLYTVQQTLNVAPIAYAELYRRSLDRVENMENITIPVENINGPILLISGEDDQMWPSTLLSQIAVKRSEQENHAHTIQHISYDDAGHGIFPPYWPTTKNQYYQLSTGQLITLGGNAKDDAYAGLDSWEKVLEFFANNLVGK